MSKLHSGLEPKEFADSPYATERYYCTSTGNLATSACPSKALGWYKKSITPDYCTEHSGEKLGTADEVRKQEEALASSEEATASTASQSE